MTAGQEQKTGEQCKLCRMDQLCQRQALVAEQSSTWRAHRQSMHTDAYSMLARAVVVGSVAGSIEIVQQWHRPSIFRQSLICHGHMTPGNGCSITQHARLHDTWHSLAQHVTTSTHCWLLQ